MSFGEIVVVLIVAIFIMKPEDVPIVVKQFKRAKKYFTTIKSDIINYFDKELKINEDEELSKDIEEINFYLQKITNLRGVYEGDYSLKDIKDKYQNLIKQKIDQGKSEI